MTLRPLAVSLAALFFAGCAGGSQSLVPNAAGCGGPQGTDWVIQGDGSGTCADARAALASGATLIAYGGTEQGFARVVGSGIPRQAASVASVDGVDTSATAPLAFGPASPLVPAIRAAKLGPRGVLRTFVAFAPTGNGLAVSSGTAQALAAWRTATLPRTADPNAWTAVVQSTTPFDDGDGNSGYHSYTVYRLNEHVPNADWYMVEYQQQSNPRYFDCKEASNALGIGSCGWYTHQRATTIRSSAGSLVDYGPTTTITTTSAGWSIGGSLGYATAYGSASYSYSWSQPDVTTTDNTNVATGVASWTENFYWQGKCGRENRHGPADTAKNAFSDSEQAAIYQVPEGASPGVSFTGDVQFGFDRCPWDGSGFAHVDDESLSGSYDGGAPILAVSPSAVALKAGSLTPIPVQITAQLSSTLGGSLGWAISGGLPSWLSANFQSGAGSQTLVLTPQPGTVAGQSTTINLTTNPPDAAPQIEQHPLPIVVTVTP